MASEAERRFFMGLDLGQAQDYTALTVCEQVRLPTEAAGLQRPAVEIQYHVAHLERFALGTPYPKIVTHVAELLRKETLHHKTTLVVDHTGVGRAVTDLFREAGLSPMPVTITGGDNVNREHGEWKVPKRDLAGILQVLLQSERLKIAAHLPLVQVLEKELLAFRVKINVATGHDSYEAWREGDHDDLVLAVAMACWAGEKSAGVGMAII